MKNLDIIFLRSDIATSNPILDRKQMDFLFELGKAGFNVTRGGTPVFYIESGGSEEKFKLIQHLYKAPYYIISTSSDNSLPASLEIVSYLAKRGEKAYLIHGEIDEIIRGLNDVKERKEASIYRLNLKSKLLEGSRLGVLGKPSDWLIASTVDYALAKEKLGAELINIPYDEFLDRIDKAVVDDEDSKLFASMYKTDKVSEKEINLAMRIHKALTEIGDAYKLDAITVRCFDLLSTVKSTSCLSFAYLNSMGTVATCEGDIPAMLSMMIVRKLFKESSFQCNPSYVNEVKNYMILAHCTVPFDMCLTYHLDTHFESGIGIGVKGELNEENITILKLSSDLTEFMVMDAKIGENLAKNNLCRTQIKVRTDADLGSLLAHPLGNHLIVFYGHHAETIKKILG